MPFVADLADLPLIGIAQACKEQSRRFFQRLSHDPRYCYELFRRAVVERTQEAWELLYAQYLPLMQHWIKKHKSLAAGSEEMAGFANDAFAKFALAVNAEKFSRFPNLKSILGYLALCTNSVMIDHRREANRWQEDDQEPTKPDFVEGLLDELTRQELWKLIERHLRNDVERLLMHCLYGLGMKPSALCQQWPEHFPDIKRTQQMHQNILARLRRDDDIWRLFKGDQPDNV
jgi:DNA-directed RNA polymerase specialized sigma24 family protein